MQAMRSFGIGQNGFQGALPEIGLQAMQAMGSFCIDQNGFKGALPGIGLQSMRAVYNFQIHQNGFEGALPGIGLQSVRVQLFCFRIDMNGFEGALSEILQSIRESSVFYFGICQNGFEGALPESGLQSLRAVEFLIIYNNFFEGTLPENGLQAMPKVRCLNLDRSRLSGALPDEGVRQLTKLVVLCVGYVLPLFDALCLIRTSRGGFCAPIASFSGAIPSSLSAPVAVLRDNLLAGSIPERLLKKHHYIQKYIVADALDVLDACRAKLSGSTSLHAAIAFGEISREFRVSCALGFMHADHRRLGRPTQADGMHHEGAIPKSASRMTMEGNLLSCGHGLRGLLPSIPGTLHTLSLSENRLEGLLPCGRGPQ
eukprot:2115701-Amphidinium_carterae.3